MNELEPQAGAVEGGEVTCPHCGTRNPAGSYFCNRCGTALGAESAPPRDPAAPMAPSEAFDASLGEQGAPAPPSGAAPPPASPADVELDAGAESVVDAVDEPTIDALIAAYQPPEEERRPPPAEPVSFPDEQLLGGSLGYLELVSVSGEMPAPASDVRPTLGGDSEHWRTMRTLLRDEPVLATAGMGGSTLRVNNRPLWALLLVLAAALAGMLLGGGSRHGAPQPLSGAEAAFAALRALEVDDEVLVVWMADPATAGEVNLAALPVVSHLVESEARSMVVGTRPASLAAARRLYADAVAGLDESAMRSVVDNWMGDGLFVPGGQTALALVAADPARALTFVPGVTPEPRLVLLVAANPNDVQEWLEAGWPRLRLPTVAVLPATGDPLLRPYLQSGQLDGLVAGFDGAASYQALRENALGSGAAALQQGVTQAQNWAALAVVVVLAAGNVFTLFGRRRRV